MLLQLKDLLEHFVETLGSKYKSPGAQTIGLGEQQFVMDIVRQVVKYCHQVTTILAVGPQ